MYVLFSLSKKAVAGKVTFSCNSPYWGKAKIHRNIFNVKAMLKLDAILTRMTKPLSSQLIVVETTNVIRYFEPCILNINTR